MSESVEFIMRVIARPAQMFLISSELRHILSKAIPAPIIEGVASSEGMCDRGLLMGD